MTPIFMLNHIGDPNWIKGFQFEGDIFQKGGDTHIGRFIGEVLLAPPPMDITESYDHVFLTILNVIPGLIEKNTCVFRKQLAIINNK